MKSSGPTSSIVLREEIMLHGPVVAVVTASERDWQTFVYWYTKNITGVMYAKDIADPNAPGTTQHCVSVVGWDTDSWIIQNSYGSEWG